MNRLFLAFVFLGVFAGHSEVWAKKSDRTYPVPPPQEDRADRLPPCLGRDRSALGVNNEEVLEWKQTSPNQYKDRALISGQLVGIILERKSHLHLEVDLDIGAESGQDRSGHIEIVYNRSFGEVTDLQPGDEVMACGDYITAREQAGPYKPSPVGAIIHWVHASNNEGKHASGFLSIAGVLYGHHGEAREWAAKNLLPAYERFSSLFAPVF